MSGRERSHWTPKTDGFGVVRTLAALSLCLAGLGAAQADGGLAKSKGCMGCHAVGQKLVGPSFAAVADRYAKTPAAPAMVAKNILSGWKGAWGDVPMPAQDHLSPAEADVLARWVLAQRP